MRIENLISSLDTLSDEQLLIRLQEVRHNREIARPVATRKAAKVEAKQTRGKKTAAEKMLAALSEEDRQRLIEQYIKDQENGT